MLYLLERVRIWLEVGELTVTVFFDRGQPGIWLH